MILNCPHCGVEISEGLVNGLAFCVHCNRVFNSSLKNRLLATSWLLKKNNYHGIDELISDTKIPESEAILVYSFIVDNHYSPQEFEQTLNHFGIDK